MADIIEFPTRGTRAPADVFGGQIPFHPAGGGYPGGLLPGKSSKLEQMMAEIAELYDDPSKVDAACCRFNLRDGDEGEPQEIDFSSLTELVVFSPEIQKDGFHASETAGELSGAVRWGDVFLKSGDVYPFLFTIYTEDYVREQLLSYGEKIQPSPKDVILRKKHLSPSDIIRAVIKWANLYCPYQLGRRVRLENDAVLRELVCEPEIEVVVSEPT